jgi:hypothetical protein
LPVPKFVADNAMPFGDPKFNPWPVSSRLKNLTRRPILILTSRLAQRAKIPQPSPKGWEINAREMRAEGSRFASFAEIGEEIP